MITIGVLGTGHLGKIHLKCIKEIQEYQLVGFYDQNRDLAVQTEKEYGIRNFNSIEELIRACDVIDIVTPTLSHYTCAISALKESKHLFIEKPVTNTPEEAEILIKLSQEANVKVQVGHVERFNPAFLAARTAIKNPMFRNSPR